MCTCAKVRLGKIHEGQMRNRVAKEINCHNDKLFFPDKISLDTCANRKQRPACAYAWSVHLNKARGSRSIGLSLV